MVPVVHGAGGGLAGLMLYVTHDVGSTQTAERVAWTQAVNLPVDDAATCGKLMRRTVDDASALKAAAGVATTGRKLKKPFEHMTLSWSPGEQPTREQMTTAAHEALEARGYTGCQAFIACHEDKDHPHVHIVTCRVDPRTGRTRKPKNVRKLQRWAEAYEERTGGLQIPNRRERRLAREHNAREIRAAVKEERKPALRRTPAMEPKRVRDPRGCAIRHRTAAERQEWFAVLTEQDLDNAPSAQARAKRVEISRRQATARIDAGNQRADGFEELAAAAAVPPPVHPPERPRADLAHARIHEARVSEPPALDPPERPRADLARLRIRDTEAAAPPALHPPERPRADLAHVRIRDTEAAAPPAIAIPERRRREPEPVSAAEEQDLLAPGVGIALEVSPDRGAEQPEAGGADRPRDGADHRPDRDRD